MCMALALGLYRPPQLPFSSVNEQDHCSFQHYTGPLLRALEQCDLIFCLLESSPRTCWLGGHASKLVSLSG